MRKNELVIYSLVVSLIIGFVFLFFTPSTSAATLSGRILLQVQDKGQAWYVNPLDDRRYYLGRPDDAFQIMRAFGLGVSNNDLNSFLNSKAPTRLAGRILLKVQDKGQAYYVEPLSLKLHYLGRPLDAFNVIRGFGLGITNADLAKITSASPVITSPITTTLVNPVFATSTQQHIYPFKYKNIAFTTSLSLSANVYKNYSSADKVYTYLVDSPPPNLREAFYNMFLITTKSGDTAIKDLTTKLNNLGAINNWSADEVAEAVLAVIQYIPYDQAKADSEDREPFYPYETLYLNQGVCSDKTFLAYKILRQLGYGVAILDFPEINHSAVGISCPVEYSLAGSGYCYVEATNYFPIGVIPNSINGQAQLGDYSFDELFVENKLGTIEILNKTTGKTYQRAFLVREQAAALSSLHQDIITSRDILSNNEEIRAYNLKVETFNQNLRYFYQQ